MKKFLRISLYILANACIVLNAIYITFTILDSYNPMLHFITGNIVTKHLYIILPFLSFVFGIFFITYYWLCKKSNRKKLPYGETLRRPPIVMGRDGRRG